MKTINSREGIFTPAFLNNLKQKGSSFLSDNGCFYLMQFLYETEVGKPSIMEETKRYFKLREQFRSCYSVLKELGEREIPHACIKGAVLSKMAYGDEVWRNYHDVDILVDAECMEAVTQVLTQQGFKPGKRIEKGKIIPYSRKEKIYILSLMHQTEPYFKIYLNNMIPYAEIDVNTSAHWDSCNMFTSNCLENTEYIEVFGCKIRKLCKEQEFVALCLHHYKDMNAPYMLILQGIRLSQICDVFFYLKNVLPDKEKLIDICERYHASDAVYYCLYFCSLVFQDELIQEYLKLFVYRKTDKCVGYFGMNERYKWKSDVLDLIFKGELSDEIMDTITLEEKLRMQRLDYLWSRK